MQREGEIVFVSADGETKAVATVQVWGLILCTLKGLVRLLEREGGQGRRGCSRTIPV
jgi:hypothetical protein